MGAELTFEGDESVLEPERDTGYKGSERCRIARYNMVHFMTFTSTAKKEEGREGEIDSRINSNQGELSPEGASEHGPDQTHVSGWCARRCSPRGHGQAPLEAPSGLCQLSAPALSFTDRRMGVTVTSASRRHEITRVRSAKRSGQCPGFCTVCQRDASVSVVKKCPLWSLRPALPGGHTSKAWAGLSPTWPRPPVTGRAAQLGAPPPSTRQRRPPQGSCTSAQHL